jgi:brefeldin A-inhibited guanine nucleotide-exchange protein
MSDMNDNEMMEDVSLEDGQVTRTEEPESARPSAREEVEQDTIEQPVPVVSDDALEAETSIPEEASTAEMQDVELSESAPKVNGDTGSDDTLPATETLSSPPPPLPSKNDMPNHNASASVSSLNTIPHRTHPSISVTPGDGSIYRAGTPATASRTSLSSVPHLSLALIKPGLEIIAQSKEAKRSPALLQASQRALDQCQQEGSSAVPRDILEPLKLACELQVDRLVTPALDLIAKLVSHGFFSDESDAPRDGPSLADIVTHIITTSFTESSSPAVSVQVVKSLLALVLSNTLTVHQSSLLKAVRTVYNVYLLSTDATTQLVAQGSLTQMIHHIFGRIRRNDKSAVGTPLTAHGRSGSVTPGLNGNGNERERETEERSERGDARENETPAEEKKNLTL